MKVLFFSDLHVSETGFEYIEMLAKKEKPDLLIDLGDSTLFGEGLDYVYERLALLNIPLWCIGGNHESKKALVDELNKHNFEFTHQQIKAIGGVHFVMFGGLGFTERSKAFSKWIEGQDLTDAKEIVLLTHQPPHGTKLDIVWGEHTGSKDFFDFVKNNDNVTWHLSGHIHDCAFMEDKLNNATLVNISTTAKVIEFNQE